MISSMTTTEVSIGVAKSSPQPAGCGVWSQGCSTGYSLAGLKNVKRECVMTDERSDTDRLRDAALVPGPGLYSRPTDRLAWALAASDVSSWRHPRVRRFSPTSTTIAVWPAHPSASRPYVFRRCGYMSTRRRPTARGRDAVSTDVAGTSGVLIVTTEPRYSTRVRVFRVVSNAV